MAKSQGNSKSAAKKRVTTGKPAGTAAKKSTQTKERRPAKAAKSGRGPKKGNDAPKGKVTGSAPKSARPSKTEALVAAPPWGTVFNTKFIQPAHDATIPEFDIVTVNGGMAANIFVTVEARKKSDNSPANVVALQIWQPPTAAPTDPDAAPSGPIDVDQTTAQATFTFQNVSLNSSKSSLASQLTLPIAHVRAWAGTQAPLDPMDPMAPRPITWDSPDDQDFFCHTFNA